MAVAFSQLEIVWRNFLRPRAVFKKYEQAAAVHPGRLSLYTCTTEGPEPSTISNRGELKSPFVGMAGMTIRSGRKTTIGSWFSATKVESCEKVTMSIQHQISEGEIGRTMS